jgi:hypothetical protein
MRRVLGVTFTGLGSFLIVIAILARFFLPGQVIKFPLNEYTISRLGGQNVSYFSQQTGTELTGATVRAVSTTQGDVSSGSSSVAVWDNVTGVFDITNGSPGVPISYSTERLAFNRRTGVLVNCCGAEIGTKRVTMSGQSYVWPIGTQKKTYQVFDTTVLKAFPAVYAGTATIDGETAYKYVETVPATQDGTQSLPGTIVGLKSTADVTLPEYYTATTTEWVDPTTGGPLKGVSQQHLYLENSSGTPVLNLLDATFTSTPASVASVVSTAKKYDTQIELVKVILPVVIGVVGIIVLLIGLVLVATRREEPEYEDDGYTDEHATGEIPV